MIHMAKANQAPKALLRSEEAVSPVVATLMLVLVAAGAAVGLSVWLGDFQDKSTDNVAAPSDAQTLRVAGSSTVFEFTKAALAGVNEGDFPSATNTPGFEAFAAAAGTPIVVENDHGGSTAGRKAVGLCLVDIGASSSDIKPEESAIYPDCNGDGIKDFGAEMRGFQVGYDAVAIVLDATVNTHCTALAFTEEQVEELYQVNGADAANTTIPATGVAGRHGSNNDITWSDLVTAGICTGTGGAQIVKLSSRSDPAGTEDGFCDKVIDKTGCDSANQLGSTYTNVNPRDGNQGIAAFLASDADSLSFIGFGHVNGDSDYVVAVVDGVTLNTASVKDGDYGSVRNLWYYTAGEPTPVEQIFLDFVTHPHRNVQFATAAGYVPFY